MSQGPKISVLLAVHNGELFISDAIRSVIGQSYNNWELIVVSNGSSDRTLKVCKDVAANQNRVSVFSLPAKNKNAAYNFAFARATGDYLCFFAADDRLPANSLKSRIGALAGAPPNAFSTCCLRTFSENPKYDGIVFPRNRTRPNFSGGSLLFPRSLGERIFPLPEEQPNEDTWTSLHLRAYGENRHVSMPLYEYRIHGGNSYGYGMPFSQKRSQYLRRMHAYRLFYEKYRDTGLSFLDVEVVPFLQGLQAATEGRITEIMRVKDLKVGSKLILALYSSPTMYRIRNACFRALSGGIAR
jgi:glycosyltransferase involved in cell wall biosynthesis